MKKQILILVTLGLAVNLAAAPAYAQAVKAEVPFSFVVLGKTLPAGEYTMTSAPHQLKIKDAKQRLVAVVIADEVSSRAAGRTGQIIFHCYGDRCFLSELQSPAEGNGRQLLMSRMEADLAKEQAGTYFAVIEKRP